MQTSGNFWKIKKSIFIAVQLYCFNGLHMALDSCDAWLNLFVLMYQLKKFVLNPASHKFIAIPPLTATLTTLENWKEMCIWKGKNTHLVDPAKMFCILSILQKSIWQLLILQNINTTFKKRISIHFLVKTWINLLIFHLHKPKQSIFQRICGHFGKHDIWGWKFVWQCQIWKCFLW